MPFLVALSVIGVLLFVLWTAFAKETGPGPADVAIAYEHAWDRFDFDLLFSLSGDELRDNMRRDAFVAAKRAAYASASHNGQPPADVRVDEMVQANQTAIVVTRVSTAGGSMTNNVVLEKRAAGWLVVGYSMKP